MIEASATKMEPAVDSESLEKEPDGYRFPRVFIVSNQRTDTHGTYYGDLSGVYGNVDTTSALNSSPKIAEKVASKAREDEVDLEVTYLQENADLILVLDREDKFWDDSYTWMLVEAQSGTVVTTGKTVRCTNTCKDAVHAIDVYWSSRELRLEREGSSESAPPTTLYVYRKKGEGAKSEEPPVFCNGREIARMDNGRFIKVLLAPGTYMFESDDTKKPPVTLQLRSGETNYLEMKASKYKGLGHLRPSDEESATEEIGKMKPLANKFIFDSERIVSREDPD